MPALNTFIMVSSSTPPPSDDKFLRAKLIVQAGLNDSASALRSLRRWLISAPDDKFNQAAELVKLIRETLPAR